MAQRTTINAAGELTDAAIDALRRAESQIAVNPDDEQRVRLASLYASLATAHAVTAIALLLADAER